MADVDDGGNEELDPEDPFGITRALREVEQSHEAESADPPSVAWAPSVNDRRLLRRLRIDPDQ